jgi:hypothetical protein
MAWKLTADSKFLQPSNQDKIKVVSGSRRQSWVGTSARASLSKRILNPIDKKIEKENTMKTKLMILGLIALMLVSSSAYAGFGISADLVSRYVWRGTDFGNSASIQPNLSFTTGGLEIGAWASYALTSSAADENDLYITYSIGDLGLTLTDYYFPQSGDVFNYKDEDSIHFLEASASYSLDKLSLMAGYFFSGDPDNSLYVEASYEIVSGDDLSASLIVGAGDGMYVAEDDFNVVNVGLTMTKGAMFASYIVNPDLKTNYLVLGYSF